MFFLMRAIFWIVVVTLFLPYPSGPTSGQGADRVASQITGQVSGPAAPVRPAEAGRTTMRATKPATGRVSPSRTAPSPADAAPSALAQAARLCTAHRQACAATARAAGQLGGGLADGADLIGAYLEASGPELAPADRSLR